MKKKVLAFLLCGLPLMINAQDAFDVLQMSQTELRGTSRFQSMAGAFGALGGDLSTLTQNPAGIGVYRSSDLGITMSVDRVSTTSGVDKMTETRFNVNNIGYVGAIRLDSETVPNLNFGFTYNRLQSFNRHYVGGVANIPTSMSNFIADEFVNVPGFTEGDLYWTDDFNPYFDGYAPWAAITTYDMPTKTYGYVGIINANNDYMQGLFGDATTGNAYYEVDERGHADEYNIAFGGNVANKLYFGLDFGILDLDYRSFQAYEEELTNAYVMADDEDLLLSDITNHNTRADWGLYNYLHTEGTGVNFKLGLIWRPTQALRIGAAFHTPTYYDMRDTYYVEASLRAYQDGNQLYSADKGSNDGYDYSSSYTISTPWRFMGSVAGVIGTQGIISLDYEYVANQTMRIGDDRGNNYPDVTANVKDYFKPSHIIRVGAEYRLTPNWSLRGGYSYKTTQVEKGVDEYDYNISTVGTNPTYQYDNTVQNITCGVGYRYKAFYTDLAYVHNMRESVYNAFSPINDQYGYEPNVSADVKDNNNRFSLTLGMRF
ncbi:MAG: outer membrane protein transport protein [Muribaculaceae bacterium]|nr:outer membrane protein transport protein [Muribaculaceae bacterium]MBR5686304.1 outer membrane protein transport protein [Muribaculaceae bacterium]